MSIYCTECDGIESSSTYRGQYYSKEMTESYSTQFAIENLSNDKVHAYVAKI